MFDVFTTPVVNAPGVTITVATVVVFALVFVAAFMLRYALKAFVAIQTRRGRLRREQGVTLLQLSSYIIFITAFLMALETAGISLSYLFFGSAALLVGLGFGLQQLFQDIVSGVILLLDRNINIGDVIQTTDYKGKINRIGVRTTTLLTIDNVAIIIPNSKLLNVAMNNLATHRGVARFRFLVPVAYNSDVNKVRDLLVATVLTHEAVHAHPPPTVIIREFAESAIVFEMRVWLTELYQTEIILSDLRYAVFNACRENGIVIPVPQREIHVRTAVVSDVTKDFNVDPPKSFVSKFAQAKSGK